jgi:hypothetical protein
LSNLVKLEPGQHAVVVLDNGDDQKKTAINSAIGLMQGGWSQSDGAGEKA